MRPGKKKRLEELRMRREIADRLFFMAMPFYAEVRQHSHEILKGWKENYMAAVACLVSKGCDRESLSVILDLSAAIKLNEDKYKVPSAKKVKTLTNRMRRLARDIRAAEFTHFMFIVNEQETGYADFGPDNEMEDVSLTDPFLTLPKWLEKRASMYEEWSRLVSRKVPPKDRGVAHLSRVCLALYVQYATKKTYFPEVVNLLECVNFGISGNYKTTQLSREVKEFKTDSSWCYEWLKTQFEELELERQNRNQRAPHRNTNSNTTVRSGEQVRASTHSGKSRTSLKNPKDSKDELLD
jgi:hypothetical protein